MAGSDLSEIIGREAAARGIVGLDTFRVPESWRGSRERTYRKMASEAKIPDRWLNVSNAEEIVKACVNPAIKQAIKGLTWNPEMLEWTS